MAKNRLAAIYTERLRLRRVQAADLQAVHAIMSDQEAMRYWSGPAHASLTETETWFASMLDADEAQQSDEFIIERLGKAIGKIGVWRVPELGFFLHRDYWGRGFGTEALLAFIDYARARKMTLLKADVDPRNNACIQILKKCGFVETGKKAATYVVNGVTCDSVYLQLSLQGEGMR